jgi:hypothetical protein
MEPIVAARAALIRELEGVVSDDSAALDAGFDAPRALAIDALGELRAVESVDLLLRHATYRADEIVRALSHLDGRPAVRALVNIGFGSVPRVLRNEVLTSASPEALTCYALVIRYVFPDAKTARAFVDAYDPGYTLAARAKLDELKQELAKLP